MLKETWRLDAPRILLIDEIATNRCIFSHLLTHRGFHVVEARSGRAALDCVENDPPAIVLADLNLRDISGLGVIRALRRNHDMCSLPIIAISPDDDQDVAIECLACGANDHLARPVQLPLLLARVETLIETRRAHLEAMQQMEAAESAFKHRLISRIDTVLRRSAFAAHPH
ncbi:MAG: response regulator [Caulobacterales bacterium]